MELLRQIRVAVIGMPDAGKSTFIKTMLQTVIGKELSPDTLMNEVHWSDGKDPYGNPDTRTIKCAKIIFKYRDKEFCFYDCPGHTEYSDQICQGINNAHHIIRIVDAKRAKQSFAYLSSLSCLKNFYTIYSHADKNCWPYYDTESDGFDLIAQRLLDEMYEITEGVDVEDEAISIIKSCLTEQKCGMLFSGGKDSVVGLDLLYRCNIPIQVFFPQSGYDFGAVLKMVEEYEILYNTSIIAFNNSLGKNYSLNSPFEMLNAKAEANNKLIKLMGWDIVSVQYRASDEGVRSKDYHISDRGDHKRFSPVFYFSESNIWRYIAKHHIPFCDLYLTGYRSLGDYPITNPCMPSFKCVEEIIEWIDGHPETAERDGRTAQDNSEAFAMEKLRNNGFF